MDKNMTLWLYLVDVATFQLHLVIPPVQLPDTYIA